MKCFLDSSSPLVKLRVNKDLIIATPELKHQGKSLKHQGKTLQARLRAFRSGFEPSDQGDFFQTRVRAFMPG